MKQDGANFLRDCVAWLNSRTESLNEGKHHRRLIKEFIEETDVDPNDYNY